MTSANAASDLMQLPPEKYITLFSKILATGAQAFATNNTVAKGSSRV